MRIYFTFKLYTLPSKFHEKGLGSNLSGLNDVKRLLLNVSHCLMCSQIQRFDVIRPWDNRTRSPCDVILILDMRKFDYLMIFTIFGKKIISRGQNQNLFYQIWLKDYVTRSNHYVIRLT